MNWNLSPKEFDELPHRYPLIWSKINKESHKKRETEKVQNG